ncbi:MAG: S4 domain-containing protein, partial [Aeromicrobium sp.]
MSLEQTAPRDEPSAALEHKVLRVPEGLAGERVDSALARLLGLSRTRASELVADGHVSLDGKPPAKSDRVLPGSILEASIPAPRTAIIVPVAVDDLRIIHDDEDLVV